MAIVLWAISRRYFRVRRVHACPAIEPPAGGPALQQRGATDLAGNRSGSASSARMDCFSCGGWWRQPLALGDREAAAAQGRSRRGRARYKPRETLAARPAQAVPPSSVSASSPRRRHGTPCERRAPFEALPFADPILCSRFDLQGARHSASCVDFPFLPATALVVAGAGGFGFGSFVPR
jgi:hypothetical protein